LLQCRCSRVANWIFGREPTGKSAVDGSKEQCSTADALCFELVGYAFAGNALFRKVGSRAEKHPATIDKAANALPRYRLEFACIPQARLPLGGCLQDCGRQRMFAAALDTCGQLQ